MKRLVVPALLLLLVATMGLSGYLYYQVRTLQTDPNQVAQKEVDQLLAEVGQLILLPEGEMPTVATVSDPELLKDQSFFAQARKGDRVLLFTTSKKAILYNPEEHKIVEVAPINLGAAQPPTGASPEVAGATTETDSDTESPETQP